MVSCEIFIIFFFNIFLNFQIYISFDKKKRFLKISGVQFFSKK